MLVTGLLNMGRRSGNWRRFGPRFRYLLVEYPLWVRRSNFDFHAYGSNIHLCNADEERERTKKILPDSIPKSTSTSRFALELSSVEIPGVSVLGRRSSSDYPAGLFTFLCNGFSYDSERTTPLHLAIKRFQLQVPWISYADASGSICAQCQYVKHRCAGDRYVCVCERRNIAGFERFDVPCGRNRSRSWAFLEAHFVPLDFHARMGGAVSHCTERY